MIQSTDVREFFAVYAQALERFKHKEYDRAWQLLDDFTQQSGARSLVVDLLRAHILWEQKKYVSEVTQLESLLVTYADSEDEKRLAGAYSLLGGAYARLGACEEAVAAYMQSARFEPEVPKKLVEISNALFTANAIEGFSADSMQEFYSLYRHYLREVVKAPFSQPQWCHERIRVGYLSADLMDHAVGQFVRPLFFEYDGSRFEVFVYQLNKMEDFVTDDLQRASVHWRNLAGQDFSAIAQAIRCDEIDILVELGGHTGNNALPVLAYRPAKVQISGIGYFNSTGILECDGFLSDMYCAPEEKSPYFTEKLLRLSHTHFCYHPYKEFPELTPPPCLKKGYITFGSFNNFVKVNDGILLLWREILAKVPSSKLLLKHQLLGTEEGREYTIKRLKRLDMPLERIELRAYSLDYLQEYGDMDIALDTSPYPGGLTTCEALYMGVPVVSLCGNRHGARFGYSFLKNLGLEELSADSKEEYVSIATALARDSELLTFLRGRLRGMMQKSPLMDSYAYMREVEELYRYLMHKNTTKNVDMDKACETVVAKERDFLAGHSGGNDFTLEELKCDLEPVFREYGWRDSVSEISSILLLHSEANGDFIMSSALIREIRKCYPKAFITLMVSASCRELAETCPYVNEVKIRTDACDVSALKECMASMLKEIPALLERHYSLGVSWNEGRGENDKLLLYLAGVCQRVGYGPYVFEGAEMKPEAKLWYDMLTLAVPRNRGEALRDSEKALRLLEALTGKTVEDRSLEVWTDEEDEKAAAAVLRNLRVRGYRHIYALMPGVSEERRRWPVDRWARLSEAILAREPRTAIVILGGPREQRIAHWLEEELNKNFRGRVVSAAGRLTFRGTAALLKRCQKYLGNDTGAVHLSVAQKVPVLVAYAYPLDLKLYSVSMPVRFAPWGVPAVQVFPKEHRDDCHDIDGPGCSRKDEAHCILGISVETMLYAYEALNMQIAKGAQKPIRFC